MQYRLSQQWKAEMTQRIHAFVHDGGEHINYTTAINQAITFLVLRLTAEGVPFKIYSLGGSVKWITTNTDICPCCKRKVAPKESEEGR